MPQLHRAQRFLVRAALAAGLALALGASAQPAFAAAAKRAERLNVVLILTDDERASTPRLPSVERLLAAHGVTFTHFFATTPECCPARAGILSGQYSHHNGVTQNEGLSSYPAFDESSNLAVWLHGAGYRTALVGKYLNGYSVYGNHEIPPGWTDWQAVDSAPVQRYYDYVLNENGRSVAYGNSPFDYSTAVLTSKAVDFLRAVQQPFFLYFAPIAPHLPATPPPGESGGAPIPELALRPSFNESDLSDKPWRALHPRLLSPGAVDFLEHSIVQPQLEARDALDRSVDEIVATLKRRHLLGRTVILYASDNGFLWGEHRLGGKVWPYEESIRVPLVVRTPWAARARTDDHLVLNIDLASTIAELADVTPELPQDGSSIVPFLRGDDPPWRTGFVVEYRGRSLLGQGGAPPYRGIRTRRYLYVQYDNGWRELYDLERDPWELRNLALDPFYAATRELLARRLERLYDAPPG